MTMLLASVENQPAVLCTVAVAAALLAYYASRSGERHAARTYKGVKLRDVPLPKDTLPVLGNTLILTWEWTRIRDWVIQQCLEFKGEPWLRRFIGFPEMLTFSSPEAIEEITTTQFENFEKGERQIEIISGFFGRGLVASDGARWYHQRKTAAKFFSARTLRSFMAKSMTKNLQQLCDVLDTSAMTGEQIDLKKLFHEFTLQTFVETGLGIELNWIGSKQPHPFQSAINAASPLVVTRFTRPTWFWKAQRWLGVGVEGEITRQMSIVYNWLHDIIGQSLTGMKHAANDDAKKSVVELFVEHSQEDKDGLRTEDLADFILTFVIAARDTTASTLAWLFYALNKQPEVEARVRKEIAERFPALAGRKDVLLTSEHTKELIYLEATVRETLRLYPAAPSTVKQAVRDTIVCGDVLVRKGQGCILHTLAMAMNPLVWGPDAAEFKPERWIDAHGQIRHFAASKFFTFYAGPRTCIGMNLALLELRVVTANLVNRYRFAVDPANDGSSTAGPTYLMKHPLLANVRHA